MYMSLDRPYYINGVDLYIYIYILMNVRMPWLTGIALQGVVDLSEMSLL